MQELESFFPLQTFLPVYILVALTTISTTTTKAQYSPPSPHVLSGGIINGISAGLVGHGITHGTADIVPVSNGVLMGTAKVYPIRPNPLATNNVGSFSVALPDLGTLHVSYKANTAEGYGFLCDFVYDGSTAKPEAVPQELAQISGYKG